MAKGEAAGLEELTRRYGQLGMALEQANQQVLAYLIERSAGGGTLGEKLEALAGKIDRLAAGGATASTSTAAAGGEASSKAASGSVMEKLDQLDARFKALSEKAAAIDALKEAFVPTLVKVRDGLSEQHAALGGGIRQVQQQFDEGLRALGRHAPAGHRPFPAAAGSRLPGRRLAGGHPRPRAGRASGAQLPAAALADRLSPGRAGGLLAGRTIAGLPLLAGRKNAHPAQGHRRGLLPLEPAHHRQARRNGKRPGRLAPAGREQAGMSNTIELVHPGQRFDSMRHNAAERGVEITTCSAGPCSATTARSTPRPASP